MKMNKRTLMAVKEYFETGMDFDISELQEQIVKDVGFLKSDGYNPNLPSYIASDECEITWDKIFICNLEEFLIDYTQHFIDRVCNVLDSFVGEEIYDKE